MVIVSDLHGLTATQVVRITVINTDLSVTIDSVSGTFEEGSEVTVNGSAADPTGAATVLTLVYEVLLGNTVVASDIGGQSCQLCLYARRRGRLSRTGDRPGG